MLKFSFGEPFEAPCALVLGGFDGLHLGHRRLLSEAKRSSLPVVLTTMYGCKGKQLFTAAERELIFCRAGVGALCEIALDGGIRQMSAEAFARKLFSLFDAREVYCGEDFRFGRNAEGTPAFLKRYAAGSVFVCKPVKYLDGESGRMRKFSTSYCKELLKKGELSRLNACLHSSGEDLSGGAYFISGAVEHGRQVGRSYGFPTLNLSAPKEKLLPPDGVYRGVCETPQGVFPALVNIGARPTFGVEERKIEVYLYGFSGDLYGARVNVIPVEFLRPIKQFSSVEELKKQLLTDVRSLREGGNL